MTVETNSYTPSGPGRTTPYQEMLELLEVLNEDVSPEALMTQRELGNASGVAPETINRIENSAEPRRTAAITVRKLAAALEVTPSELLGG
jgi:DNA-binding XRE family transcriptional regulator